MADESRVALEAACAALGNPATHAEAERVILDFHNSADPIPACLHVLQTTRVVDAMFQAAVALRKACINNGWALLAPESRLQLRIWLLQFLVHRGKQGVEGPMAAVVHTVMEAHALVLKLLWLEVPHDQAASFVQELCSHAEQRTEDSGIFLRATATVVTEFNPATASSTGLSWASHERCREGFETMALQRVFQAGSTAAMMAPLHGANLHVATEAVGLLCAVLTWGFQRPNSTGTGALSAERFGGRSADPAADLTAARAPQEWVALAHAPPLRRWLVEALAAHASAAAAAAAGAAGGLLASRLRQLLVQMCLLGPWDARGGGCAAVAEVGVHGLLAILQPRDAFVAAAERCGEEDIVRDVAKATSALFKMVTAARVEAVVGGEALLRLWHVAAQVTIDLLARGGASVDSATDWHGVSTGLLLDMWTRVLSQLQAGAALGGAEVASARVDSAARECAHEVFSELLKAQLEEYAAGAEADADDDAAEAAEQWEADSLDQIAALARACLPSSLRALHGVLSSTAAAMLFSARSAAAAAAPESVSAAAQEQLWWLLRVTAAVVADDARGEVPMVPLEVELLCDAGHPSAEYLPEIGKIILEVASLPTGPNKSLASPRLLESALWALARWTDTYGYCAAGKAPLEVDAESGSVWQGASQEPPSAAAQLLAPRDVAAMATQILTALIACVSHYPGETALHEVAVDRLLHAVVCRPGRSGHLQQVPAWRELTQAFAAHPLPGAFAGLNSRLHRPLAAAVCSHVAGFRSLDRSGKVDMLQHLMESTLVEVRLFDPGASGARAHDAASAATKPPMVEKMAVVLERLRGAVEGSNLNANCAVYDVVMPCLWPLLDARKIFSAQPLLQQLTLQLATALASSHSGALHREKAEQLAAWSLRLLDDFAAAQRAAAAEHGAQGRAAQHEAEAERADFFEAAFELILNLAELLDHVSTEGIVESIFRAYQTLLTAVPPEILAYPAVAAACALAVLKICEFYPERVLCLPPQHFHTLLDALLWGLRQPSVHTVNLALRGLAELATCHQNQITSGHPGLAAFTTRDAKPITSHLMTATLSALHQFRPADVLTAAAEALRPLLATSPSTFSAAVSELLPAEAWAPLAQHAAGHMEKLQRISADPSASMRVFEVAFANFIGLLRGAMHRK